MIEVDCVKCGMIIYAMEESAGLKRQCPSCGTMNVVVQRAEDEPVVEAELIEAPPADPAPSAESPMTAEELPEDPPPEVAELVKPPPVVGQVPTAAGPPVDLGPPPLPDADDLAADALDDIEDRPPPPPPSAGLPPAAAVAPAVAVPGQPAPRVAPLTGLGGWLILPCIHLVISMITIPAGRDRAYVRVEGLDEDLAGAMGACVRTVSIGWYLYLAFTIFVMVQFFRKRREAPALMKAWYGAAIGLTWIQGFWLEVIHHGEMFRYGLVGITVYSIIWIAYFSTSKRVENTFTAGPVRAPSR